MSLSDPPDDVDYNIQPELRMRKLLERMTPYWVEFNKNDQYEYDLECHHWHQTAEGWDKSLCGYVELEHAKNWTGDDLPDNWVYFSALRRKVHDYDRTLRAWSDLKDEANQTVYLKFNSSLTNSVAAPIEVFDHDGTPTKRSDGSYNGSFLAVDWSHPRVSVGLNSSVALLQSELITDTQ